nr:hypothetical protein [Clostridium paraputrificum]
MKFTSNEEVLSLDGYIAIGSEESTIIAVANDIFIEFKGDKYIDSFELPF